MDAKVGIMTKKTGKLPGTGGITSHNIPPSTIVCLCLGLSVRVLVRVVINVRVKSYGVWLGLWLRLVSYLVLTEP